MFEGDELHESLAACEQSDASWEYMTGRFFRVDNGLQAEGRQFSWHCCPIALVPRHTTCPSAVFP